MYPHAHAELDLDASDELASPMQLRLTLGSRNVTGLASGGIGGGGFASFATEDALALFCGVEVHGDRLRPPCCIVSLGA